MKRYDISVEYRTGNDTIDQEHAKLLDLTQKAYQLFKNENILFKCADINRILSGIEFYTGRHFVDEEEYMAGMGYEDIEHHRMLHEGFTRKLKDFIERVPRLSLDTQDELILELFEYLQEWWKVHITVEDMKYVKYGEEHKEV